MTPKRAGFCSVCDIGLAEVVQTWTDGGRKGEPRLFGPMLPGAQRAHVALLDGSMCSFSLCAACKLTPENLALVWKRTLMATRLEASPEWRMARELKPYDERQKLAMLKNLARFMRNIPVGVICTQTYAEIKDG